MWDNIGTMHNAVADYRPDQRRYMRRCQVMADWIFAHPLVDNASSAPGAIRYDCDTATPFYRRALLTRPTHLCNLPP